MSAKKEKDYTRMGFGITALVFVFLIGIMFIPGTRVGGIVIKRANILSDIIKFEPDPAPTTVVCDLDEELILQAESTIHAEKESPDKTQAIAKQTSWNVSDEPTEEEFAIGKQEDIPLPADISTPEAEVLGGGSIVAIEDFNIGEGFSMNDFYRTLGSQSQHRPVRIAVLGDSFIEGDIFVADLREQLQKLYSGHGVGFVPFASNVSQYRGTIKHTHSGWETFTTLNIKSLPEHIKGGFFVSCLVSEAGEGAVSYFEGNYFRKNLRRVNVATLLFTNEVGSTINVTINDSIYKSFTPEPSPIPQSMRIEGSIEKLGVEIENPAGFFGYGVGFDDRKGVSVDNYSLRGNSGLALFGTTYEMNRHMNKLRGFDLIILEYGLNVLSPDVTEYGWYKKNLVRIINFLKVCYPNTAILVMGIADRSTQESGEFVTMVGVEPMIAVQRKAAKECGVAFWSTFEAMGGTGSMAEFVEKGWAAKDYTHIGFGGGRMIATSFVRALVDGKVRYEQRLRVTGDTSTTDNRKH